MRPFAFALLTFLLAPAALAQPSIGAQIARVSGDPMTDAWAHGVRSLLVGRYDRNRSGTIDTRLELANVPCEAWNAMEASVSDVLNIYGFEPTYIWVGGSLGFDEGLRQPAFEEGYRCINGAGSGSTAPGALSGAAAVVSGTLNSRPAGGGPASDLRAINQPDFYGGWDDAAGQVLVRYYDSNRSGMIEANEIAGFECGVWQAVQDSYVRAYPGSDFWIGMGIETADYLTWNAEGLLLNESARGAAWASIQRCGIAGGGTSQVRDAATELRELYDASYYGGWDDAAGNVFVSYFDQNGSGMIEGFEANQIGCDVWQAVQSRYQQEYAGSDFWIGMGFGEGLIWNAEGFRMVESARPAALASIKRCYANAQ